jgi:5-methylcytosine-specific restriction endonuclease McrA
MPKAKPLSKQLIVGAMNKTKSNRAASRYLGVSYIHYKKWAKNYDSKTHDNLFEQHKNQCGKGIPKFLNNGKKIPAVMDIIEGRIDSSHFDAAKIKDKLIAEGLLEECCTHCSFKERRVLDYKVPLIMHFKDGSKKNYKLDNVELLCYNCYFLQVGNIFNNKQIQGLEEHKPINESQVDWKVDDYHLQRLKELGLEESGGELDLISRL